VFIFACIVSMLLTPKHPRPHESKVASKQPFLKASWIVQNQSLL
jgi:hypothetical protein